MIVYINKNRKIHRISGDKYNTNMEGCKCSLAEGIQEEDGFDHPMIKLEPVYEELEYNYELLDTNVDPLKCEDEQTAGVKLESDEQKCLSVQQNEYVKCVENNSQDVFLLSRNVQVVHGGQQNRDVVQLMHLDKMGDKIKVEEEEIVDVFKEDGESQRASMHCSKALEVHLTEITGRRRGSKLFTSGDGFYYKQFGVNAAKKHYTCYKGTCVARVWTNAADGANAAARANRNRPSHNHPPEPNYGQFLALRQRIIDRVKNESLPPKEIFDSECNRVTAEVSALLPYRSFESTLMKARRNAAPPTPKSSDSH